MSGGRLLQKQTKTQIRKIRKRTKKEAKKGEEERKRNNEDAAEMLQSGGLPPARG
jgi:hypothetical protein